MSVTSRENAPGFLNNKIIVYLANIKTDIGCIRGFPGILVRGDYPTKGMTGKAPGMDR